MVGPLPGSSEDRREGDKHPVALLSGKGVNQKAGEVLQGPLPELASQGPRPRRHSPVLTAAPQEGTRLQSHHPGPGPQASPCGWRRMDVSRQVPRYEPLVPPVRF